MGEPVATPKLPPPLFKKAAAITTTDNPFSSSPGFGTPAYPIASRPPPVVTRQPFVQTSTTATTTSSNVLPILLPPQTLRPVAFRTLTKKHNLTLTSSGLGLLSTFVGKFCGSAWREESLAEKVLDEIAKAWKTQGGGVIIEDGPEKKLSTILKSLELCMSGGRIDTGKLSRSSSNLAASLSRQNSLPLRPDPNREDSQTSLGLSGLDVNDDLQEEEQEKGKDSDARTYLKVVSAFHQPRFTYSMIKKSLEVVTSSPSLLPPIQQKISMFRNRYHLVHQRLMRNESFQTPSFSSNRGPPSLMHSGSSVVTAQQAYKITPISNLLGRSGTSHLMLGMLVNTAAGDLAVADLTGSVALDMSFAKCVPEDGAWFCPGMIVLAEGMYQEDGSNNSNLGSAAGVGGQIKGRFVVDTLAGPPAERRDLTLGTANSMKPDNAQTSIGAGFGWVDFLGVGSEKAVGTQMRRLQRRVLGNANEEDEEPKRRKMIIIGECHLDSPRTLEAIRAILNSYTISGEYEQRPLSIIFMGNFVSAASMAGSTKGGGSVEYKEYFDALASMLSEFPTLLSSTSLVFVPGDNDPWASSFSAGASTIMPRQGVPELFTSRIRRAIATANNEAKNKDNEAPGEAIWTSNPSRVTLFGPTEEIVLFRDDITSRLRRNAVTFPKLHDDDEEHDTTLTTNENNPDPDPTVHEAASHLPHSAAQPYTNTTKTDTATARKLVKTVLDQGHLSPFPLSVRPVLWDYASSLSMYPLPTALVLADAEHPAFAITYEGCHVMNPGKVLDELGARKGVAKWIEYDVRSRRGLVRDVRF